MNTSYLINGLTAISRCKEKTGDIWQAHLGAALIAGHFFQAENTLESSTRQAVFDQMDDLIDHNQDVFAPPFPSGPTVDFESAIIEALSETIDRLCWVGHNVIYSALSLKALRELPELGTSELVDGIVELVRTFNKSVPGRSWIGWTGREVKNLATPTDILLHVQDANHLSNCILDEISRFRTIYKAEAHNDLMGHLLTHSQALVILYDLGYQEIFERGINPLKKQVKILRSSQDLPPGTEFTVSSPVDKPPLEVATPLPESPLDLKYWQKDYRESNWYFGHTFKFPYSYFDHVKHASKEKEGESNSNFQYILDLLD